jgi:hypothetical protein
MRVDAGTGLKVWEGNPQLNNEMNALDYGFMIQPNIP